MRNQQICNTFSAFLSDGSQKCCQVRTPGGQAQEGRQRCLVGLYGQMVFHLLADGIGQLKARCQYREDVTLSRQE